MHSNYAPTPLEFLLTLGSSWVLVGIILTIHFVHYPSFRYVSADWAAAHSAHTATIGPLVGPLMVLELLVSVWLVYRTGASWVWIVPLALVLMIWANTFLQAVPLHQRLGSGFDRALVERLIRVDTIRTGLWVLKALWISGLFLRS